MSFTTKQVAIVDVVLKGNGSDPTTKAFIPVDLDQLIDRLDYEPTKQSIQFSIRALVRHGLIEKGPRVHRRGRSRVTLLPTDYARQVMTFAPNPGMVAAAPLPGAAASSSSAVSLFGSAGPLEEVIEDM